MLLSAHFWDSVRWNLRFRRRQAYGGQAARVTPACSAFTLVEILLVLALMALAGAVLLPAAGALFRRSVPEGPADMIADLMQEVRREAVLTGREVTLSFDVEAQRFRWDGTTGGSRSADGPRLSVDFLRAANRSTVLIGGRLLETDPRPTLVFYPDGTCDPVRVQLRRSTGAVEVLAIDPWTCAPGLEVTP